MLGLNVGSTSLVLALLVAPATAAWLRGTGEPDKVPQSGEKDGMKFKVLETTEMKTEKSADCVCPLGKFWHYRIEKCVEQGGWGYECGYFPKEHWHRVCKDGLKCVPLQDDKDTTYNQFGKRFKKPAKSEAATCVPCTAEDGCKTGTDRQTSECPKAQFLTGETCVTVEVEAKGPKVQTSAEVTEKATKKAAEKATATATATATARACAKEDPNICATATVSVEATGNGDHEDEATASHTAVDTSGGSSKGKGTGKACVSVSEAVKSLRLTMTVKDGKAKVGEVLQKKITKHAEHLAWQLALGKARVNALGHAVKKAKEAAKADAVEDAKKVAKKEAESKAEVRASKGAKAVATAEANTEAESTAKANAEAKAKAEAQAKADAAYQAKVKAEAEAKAEAQAKEAAAAKKAEAAAEAKAAEAKQEEKTEKATASKEKTDGAAKEKTDGAAKEKTDGAAKEKTEAQSKEDAAAKEKAEAMKKAQEAMNSGNAPGMGPPEGPGSVGIPQPKKERVIHEVPKVPSAKQTFDP